MLVAHTLLQVVGQKLRQDQSQICIFPDRVVDGKGQAKGKGKGKGRGRGLGEGRGRGNEKDHPEAFNQQHLCQTRQPQAPPEGAPNQAPPNLGA